jgi:hypothetical protein
MSTRGLYTKILREEDAAQLPILDSITPYLPKLINYCYLSAKTDQEKEKITKLILLWISKEFISQSLGISIIKVYLTNYCI